MKNFWRKLHKKVLKENRPILALAPMADVTDAAFRKIIAKYGKPDVMFTEFVSADGLVSVGKKNLLIHLKYSEAERPIVAQIFGAKPENIFASAALCACLGFDGIDINMGCPEKNILKQGACGALIKNPLLAKEIILAARRGAKDIPVSVKTRIGFSQNEIETWIPTLLETEPAAISIHGRTVKEMSKVPARWDIIGRAVKIRDEMKSKTLIIGNGDVFNIPDALLKAQQYGVDGVMIGRSVFGNPWLFQQNRRSGQLTTPTTRQKLRVLLEHTQYFSKIFGERKNFSIMKKHFKAYASGFDGAKELRIKLMETKNTSDVKKAIKKFLLDRKKIL